jgi:protease II
MPSARRTFHYRWLEDWTDPEVKAWSAAQNTYARGILDTLPHVDFVRARVTELLSAPTVSYWALATNGPRLFAMKRHPPKEQPFLVVMDTAFDTATERVLLDPGVLDKSGPTSIDWFKVSPDGRLVAVSLSKGGSESGDLYLYDAATGRAADEVIERVNGGTAGGDVAWLPDSSGFQRGDPSEIRAFDLNGKPLDAPKQLAVASASDLLCTDGDDILFANGSYTASWDWYRFSADSGTTTKTGLVSDAPVDMAGFEVVREFADTESGSFVPAHAPRKCQPELTPLHLSTDKRLRLRISARGRRASGSRRSPAPRGPARRPRAPRP